MAKPHSVTVRFTEVELIRILRQKGLADRSDSDTIRRLLAERCEQIERAAAQGGR